MNNPYQVLGISPDATDDEVKQAYRELARKYHPDKYRDSDLADLASEKMKEINAAYEEIQKQRAMRGKSQQNAGNGYTGNPNAGSNNELYARIRTLINQNEIREAERLLRSVPGNEQDAEWYFLMGCVLYKRGYYIDAQKMFERACTMDPYNKEYGAARDQLRNQSAQYGSGYRTAGGNDSFDSACNCCSNLICADCCCEMMGGDLIPCC